MKRKFRPVSETKEDLLAYILGYATDNGYPPTLDEMAIHLTERNGYHLSKERTRQILGVLVKDGRVKIDKYAWRGVRIIERPATS